MGFILAGFALAGSPGPATLSLAAIGTAFGARQGLGYAAGLLAGLLAVMGVTATGVVGLLLAVPGARPIVVGLASAYFVYLAWRIATAAPPQARAAEGPAPSFGGGVFLSLLNPKGYAAMATLFSGFTLAPGSIGADVALKMAVLAAIIASVNVAWLAMGAALTRVFQSPRANRVVNIAFAALLLISVALAALL